MPMFADVFAPYNDRVGDAVSPALMGAPNHSNSGDDSAALRRQTVVLAAIRDRGEPIKLALITP